MAKALLRLLAAVLLFGAAVTLVWRYSHKATEQPSPIAEQEVKEPTPLIAAERATVKIYLPSADSHGLLEGAVQVNDFRSNLALWVAELLQALSSVGAQGALHVFPSTSKLQSAFLSAEGTLYLDLPAAAYSFFQGGVELETLAVESVVRTFVENIDGAKRVKFLADGKDRETFSGHVDVLKPVEYR